MQSENPSPRNFLVRHVSLNKFLSPAGRWVKKAEAALKFPNILNAINTCLGRELRNVELIAKFDGDKPEQKLSLDGIQ
jgi:hypothetical protein